MQYLKSEEQLSEMINKGKTILVFSADWCRDCQVIKPVLPEIENNFKDFTFIYVDRDKFIDVCVEYDVFGIPSFIGFKDGIEQGRFVSKDRKTQAEIETFIKQLA
ncbi:thioredoxin family protein [Aquibacillus salsiterrae]|uniref:Thioredoxin family protein n=1 Tax=Aquibacillus salsiterrae TaxID=2950439 RepID=A0A9X3WBP8_9BACI|nr:thioredoxin family protein [Aquibacillus salsiterrae]MDC3415798.1 thioredoxin family protein [Aquibacillus salsiterrae]